MTGERDPLDIFKEKADALRQKMIEGSIAADEGFKLLRSLRLRILRFRYLIKLQRLAEETFDSIKDTEQFARAQIELIIYRASLLRGLGRLDEARTELDDALTYAKNMGFEDVVGNYEHKGKNRPKKS